MRNLAWSPDGAAVAFALPDEDGWGEDWGVLLLLSIGTGEEIVLADHMRSTPVPLLLPAPDLLYYFLQDSWGRETGLYRVGTDGGEPASLGSPPSHAWAVSPAGDRVAWVQNPQVEDPARWLIELPEPETDRYLLHTDTLGDRPRSRSTFPIPCADDLALSPDGRLAFSCAQDVFVADPRGERIVRVAKGLKLGRPIRWIH